MLYKGAWMVPFRTLVRLKIFQLSGVAAAALPLGTFLSQVHTFKLRRNNAFQSLHFQSSKRQHTSLYSQTSNPAPFELQKRDAEFTCLPDSTETSCDLE